MKENKMSKKIKTCMAILVISIASVVFTFVLLEVISTDPGQLLILIVAVALTRLLIWAMEEMGK